MAYTQANRIYLRGHFELQENVANAALNPGHLIQLRSDGKVEKHSFAGGHAEAFFAIEDANRGLSVFNNDGTTVTTAYAAADLVPGMIFGKGAECLGILKAGQNVAKGAKLVSNGDGTLVAATHADSATVQAPIVLAIATQALNLSATGALDTLISIRIV